MLFGHGGAEAVADTFKSPCGGRMNTSPSVFFSLLEKNLILQTKTLTSIFIETEKSHEGQIHNFSSDMCYIMQYHNIIHIEMLMINDYQYNST